MSNTHTSDWFGTLDRGRRKTLLAFLHEVRLSSKPPNTELISGLLQALEADHAEETSGERARPNRFNRVG